MEANPSFMELKAAIFWRLPLRKITELQIHITYKDEYLFRMRKEMRTNYWNLGRLLSFSYEVSLVNIKNAYREVSPVVNWFRFPTQHTLHLPAAINSMGPM